AAACTATVGPAADRPMAKVMAPVAPLRFLDVLPGTMSQLADEHRRWRLVDESKDDGGGRLQSIALPSENALGPCRASCVLDLDGAPVGADAADDDLPVGHVTSGCLLLCRLLVGGPRQADVDRSPVELRGVGCCMLLFR